MLKVFIGYDPKEAIAYTVLAHSIMRHASRPVAIVPLYQPQLRNLGVYSRVPTLNESTAFTYTRFLTPHFANTNGVSIFMDCDMLCLGDIYELVDYAFNNPYADVLVRKHDYAPSTTTKFLGQKQTVYPKKNWSSLMVFNGHRMRVRDLTPQVVNESSAADLHQFTWAKDIGDLPAEWNHLVGEQEPNPAAKLVHFTIGGPWFKEYQNCEFSNEWFNEFALATV